MEGLSLLALSCGELFLDRRAGSRPASGAHDALTAAGLEVRHERDVVVASVEDQPGTGGELLRRVADAGANVDLLYLTMDGRLVLSGSDVSAIQRALG